MMSSLFSIFDPSSKLISNWVIFFIFILMKRKNFFNQILILFNFVSKSLKMEMKILKIYLFLFLMPLFFLILSFNMVGILPFTFTATSHMSETLSLALPLWMSLMITGWLNLDNMFSHLVPLGCPSILMPFMVLIETVSLIIRPITLSVRLAANMVAGHMILSLVSMGAFNSMTIFIFSLVAESIILILELAVAFIQPYVFFVLLMLYSQEVEYK